MDPFPFDLFQTAFVNEIKAVYQQFVTRNQEKRPYIFTISVPDYIAINHPNSNCICFNGNTVKEFEEEGHSYNSKDPDELYYQYNMEEWEEHSLSDNDFPRSNEIIRDYIIRNEASISDEESCYTKDFMQFRDVFFEYLIQNIEQLKTEGFFDSFPSKGILLNFEVREYYDEDEMCRIFERLNTKKDAAQFKKWL